MRPAAGIVLVACLAGGGTESVRAQRALFQPLDFSEIVRSDIEIRDEAWDPPPVREGEAFMHPRDAPPSPDASLARPIARIGLDAEGLRLLPVNPYGAELRAALPLVDFTVAGYPARMVLIESKADPEFDALHLTLLATETEDFARLTVSRQGTEVVGTVFIADGEFRILPEDESFQLVYPVVAHVRAWRREDAPDLETRAGRLEARHLQLGWVAETRPGAFDTHDDGRPSTYAEGPSLGKLNFWSAFESDAAGNGEVDEAILKEEVEFYLNDMGHFTWVHDPVEVRIDEIDSLEIPEISNQGLTVRVSQLIYDIPLSETLTLRMGPTGEVMQFAGTLARYDMAPPVQGERILQAEARAKSAIVVLEQYGIEVTDDIVEENLFYDARNEMLDLIWRIDRKAECGLTFRIDIDAITGEALRTMLIDAGETRGRSSEDILFECRFYRSRIFSR